MEVVNKAKVLYEYKVCNNSNYIRKATYSNKISIKVLPSVLTVKKIANRKFANVYDAITYTVIISNTSCNIMKKVIFEDILTDEIKFIKNSLIVNGHRIKNLNNVEKIFLGEIEPGEKVKVVFKVLIIKLPCDRMVKNHSTVYFNSNDDLCNTIYINSNKVYTIVGETYCGC